MRSLISFHSLRELLHHCVQETLVSSQWAKRCTPTNDRRSVMRTTSAPEATGGRPSAWRGRPLGRLSVHCTRNRLRWRTLTGTSPCLWATFASSSRLGHAGSSLSNFHSLVLSISLSFLPASKGRRAH